MTSRFRAPLIFLLTTLLFIFGIELAAAQSDEVTMTLPDGESSLTLPEGWVGSFDESLGQIYAASSEDVLDALANNALTALERGEIAISIAPPSEVNFLDATGEDDPAAVLEVLMGLIEAEGDIETIDDFAVPAVLASVTSEAIPTGEADLYALAYEGGVVLVAVQAGGRRDYNSPEVFALIDSIRFTPAGDAGGGDAGAGAGAGAGNAGSGDGAGELTWINARPSGFGDDTFGYLGGVATSPDGELVYVADNTQGIWVLDAATGEILDNFDDSEFQITSDIAVDPATGNLFVSDWGASRIFTLSPDGDIIGEFGESGNDEGEFSTLSPQFIALGDGIIYAVNMLEDTFMPVIDVFDFDGEFIERFELSDDIFGTPNLDVAPDGTIYVAPFGSAIHILDETGEELQDDFAEDALFAVAGQAFALGEDGIVYHATWNEGVLVLDADGEVIESYGGSAGEVEQGFIPALGEFSAPSGLAYANGRIFVADNYSGSASAVTMISFVGDPVLGSVGEAAIVVTGGDDGGGDAVNLDADLTVEGELTDDEGQQAWTVELSEGDEVTITVIATDSGLDPVVALYTEADYERSRGPLVENDDAGNADLGAGTNSQIERFDIDDDGTYVITVRGFAGSTGSYELSIEGDNNYDLALIGGGDVGGSGDSGDDAGGGDGELLAYGDSATGNISPGREEVVFSFGGGEGDVITITVEADDPDDLDTTVSLYTARDYERGREPIAYNDDINLASGNTNSRIQSFELPEDGEYVIVVGAFTGRGDFTLTLDEGEGAGIGGGAPAAVLIAGELTDEVSLNAYTIALNEGDTLTLTVVADNESFDPRLSLYAVDSFEAFGAPITRNDDSGLVSLGSLNSLIEGFVAPEDGTYLIVVDAFGTRRGDYELSIWGDEESYEVETYVIERSLDDVETIAYGDSVEGEINEDSQGIPYLFTGAEGDEVTITLEADDPDELDTRLYLYTAEDFINGGTPIAENDDIEFLEDTNSQIAEFSLPDDGDYVILATRFGSFGEGSYVLTLETGDAGGGAGAGGADDPGTEDSGDAGDGGGIVAGDGNGGSLRQWATEAEASSQYGDDSWSAQQATGEPDAGDVCADSVAAWASETGTGEDTLTLIFDEAVIVTQVNIYQVYNPGSIIMVELGNTDVKPTFILDDSEDPPGNTPCPGVFTIDVSGIDAPINKVIIHFDQSIGGNWNEIDAVELVGNPAE
jgi:hypothetical protein